MYREWEDPSLQAKRRLPGRGNLVGYDSPEKALSYKKEKSRQYLNLNGEWEFFLAPRPQAAPEGFERPGFDASGWAKMPVPGCWQMHGYGTPVYSASPYLFPADPPFVPDDNDTGCYRTRFVLPESMRGMRLILRFEGVGSMFTVWVNGKAAGMSKGSHMTAEFDVTALCQAGENLLAVQVLRFSDGSYLEIQDMLHMSGIFRPVSLLAMPDAGVWDVSVQAGMDGLLRAQVETFGSEDVSAVLYDAAGAPVAEARGKEMEMRLAAPRLWSAEDPYLYTLVVACEGQYTPVRVGFRTVSMREKQLLVNGAPIKAKGVNHHDTNTRLGWAVDETAMLQDVLLMKRHNVNFVRTSHYPSPARFYDLADEYGLYILSEADIECHGMGITDVNTLSRDPAWEHAYVDRAERMVLRDRSHPAVIAWSMGNESGYGENFRRVSAAMRRLDGRFVHYCGAKDLPALIPEEIAKDPAKLYQMRELRRKTPDEPTVDFESTMYMSPEALPAAGEGADPRPFLVCEYAHSMGNGPGSLREYWEVFYKYPKLLGGCVWEWQDHGVLRRTPEGKPYYACGNELAMPYKRDGINGNFCNDGLLSPEKVPHPGLLELKKAIQPFFIELVSRDPVTVAVTSRYQFLRGETAGRWELVRDGAVLASGAIDIDDLAPGERREYPLPVREEGPESLLNLSFRLKEAKNWAEAGHEVACEQFVLGERPQPATPAGGPLRTRREGDLLLVEGEAFEAGFDLLHGCLVRYGKNGAQLLAAPLKQNFWRAPTDNDIGIVGPMRPGAANTWKDNGLDRLEPRLLAEPEISEAEGRLCLRLRQRWGANPFPPVLDTETAFTVYGSGAIDVAVSYRQLESPYMKEGFWWPRLGWTLQLPAGVDTIRWHGRGPGENYSDRCWSADIGWYEKRVAEMHTSYSRMQENGARTDTRSMEAAGDGLALRFEALSAPFTFTAHDYTDAALTRAWHEYELERAGATVIDIDMEQSGLGSNSCGPGPLARYKPTLASGPREFRFRMTAL